MNYLYNFLLFMFLSVPTLLIFYTYITDIHSSVFTSVPAIMAYGYIVYTIVFSITEYFFPL